MGSKVRGEAAGWRWVEAFRTAGVPFHGEAQDGLVFEQFVAAAVRALGVDNVVCGLLHSAGGQSPQMELDVAAIHRGALLIVDCKLTEKSDEAQVTELLDAAARGRALGGLGVLNVMLRPNRRVSEQHRTLADSLRVKLWDQRDAHDLFRNLAGLLGVAPMPEQAGRAQELLDRERAEHRPALGQTRNRTLFARHSNDGEHMFNLDEFLRSNARESGCPAEPFLHAGQIHIRWPIPPGLKGSKLDRVREAFEATLPANILQQFSRTRSGGSLVIRLLQASEAGKAPTRRS